jgi:hypothetical protein
LFWAIGWLAGCRSQGEGSECRTEFETIADGGLVCGLDFEMQPDPMEPGRFGVKAVPYVIVDLAGVVRVETLATVLVMIEATEEASGTDLDLDVKVCHVEFPKIEVPGQPEPTFLDLVPEAYDSMSSVPIYGSLDSGETCASFESETGVFVFGARLQKTATDPLPKDPTTQTCHDENEVGCIYDLEGDGFLGATMVTENFPLLDISQLQVTMRTGVSLSGTVVSPDRIVGGVQLGLEIEILGCRLRDSDGSEERACNQEEARMVKSLHPQIIQLEQPESPFVALRLPADVTCRDLREDADLYFGH